MTRFRGLRSGDCGVGELCGLRVGALRNLSRIPRGSAYSKLQVDLPVLDDTIALRAADAYSKYSFLIPVRPKGPPGIWNVSCISRAAIFGRPKGIQMDGGGEWGYEIRPDFVRTAVWTSGLRERARTLGPWN